MYFMSINATFAVAARTRKVSRWPCTCPMTGNILILHKPLGEGHDCLSAAGLTFCLRRVLTIIVESLTVITGNGMFLH